MATLAEVFRQRLKDAEERHQKAIEAYLAASDTEKNTEILEVAYRNGRVSMAKELAERYKDC